MSEYTFYVGTYAQGDAQSIFLYNADFEKGTFTRLDAHSSVQCPSYVIGGRNNVLYAVEELIPQGNVVALTKAEEGLRMQRRLKSGGAHPCHLALDEDERFLFAANYTSGSLAMFELDASGLPLKLCCLKQHIGSGVNPERQEGPHVHFSLVRKGLVYVCDLGLDTIFCYRVNAEEKTLEETGMNIRLPDGNGPRHLCFHPERPDWLFVIAELTAHVFVFHQENGAFILKQEIASLPENAPTDNRSAAIKLSSDAKYLFVSNRGADSVTVFAVTENGLLDWVDIHSTEGKAPRDIAVFGDYIVAANQDSSLLSVLRLDRAQGRLELLDMRETVPLPSCVLPVN